MSTYVNPDAPNPEVTDAAVRAMLAGNNSQPNGYSNTYYYAGGYPQNPFASSQNVVSVPTNDSRANVGTPQYQFPVTQQQVYAYPPTQSQIAPVWNPSYAYAQPQSNLLSYQQPQVPVPAGGYNGYPLGVDPSNYIYEYMRANTAPKNVWGENYWTAPKPIQAPQIDWTKPSQNPYDYAQYGMNAVPQIQMQPTLPQGFSFPPIQESPLDVVKKNWSYKDL